MKKNSDNVQDIAIFSQEPEVGDKHVLNYTRLLGVGLRDFRCNHPVRGLRTQEQFAVRRLSPYFNSVVSRKRVIRAEKIDLTIGFGIIAGYFNEMEVWPDIIDACTVTKVNDAEFMKLVTNELAEKAAEETRKRLESLHNNYFNHVGNSNK